MLHSRTRCKTVHKDANFMLILSLIQKSNIIHNTKLRKCSVFKWTCCPSADEHYLDIDYMEHMVITEVVTKIIMSKHEYTEFVVQITNNLHIQI